MALNKNGNLVCPLCDEECPNGECPCCEAPVFGRAKKNCKHNQEVQRRLIKEKK